MKILMACHYNKRMEFEPVSESTLFECSVCDRQFSLLSTLRKHQLTHQDDRPFTCDFPGCSKMFKVSQCLTVQKVLKMDVIIAKNIIIAVAENLRMKQFAPNVLSETRRR